MTKTDPNKTKTFTLLQSLPPDVISHVLDYMTGAEVCRLVKLDSRKIGDCVTLKHVTANHNRVDHDLIGFIRRSGRDFHVPSNQRLLRIISCLRNNRSHHLPVLCDLCHTKETFYFCSYWGLLKCEACMKYHEQHDEYEIERFPGTTHPTPVANNLDCRKKGPRKYFVRWGGDTLAKFAPLLSTGRLATHGGRWPPDFETICVLETTAFDPYTNEPCGPLITHKDIDEMDNCYSQKCIDALVASLDVNEDRMMQLMCLADGLEKEKKRRIAESQKASQLTWDLHNIV
jgi:hypothetical protein